MHRTTLESSPLGAQWGLKIAAIALVFAGIGCGSSDEADWYGDTRFTAAERAEVEAGAAWLGETSGHPFTIAWTYEITSAEPLPRTIRREPHGGSETGYCTSIPGGTVYLDVDRTAHLRGLAAHELGHCAIGLADDMRSDGIMHVLEPMQWTEREQAQLSGR